MESNFKDTINIVGIVIVIGILLSWGLGRYIDRLKTVLKVLFLIVVCVAAIAGVGWVLWFVLKGMYGFFNYYGKFA